MFIQIGTNLEGKQSSRDVVRDVTQEMTRGCAPSGLPLCDTCLCVGGSPLTPRILILVFALWLGLYRVIFDWKFLSFWSLILLFVKNMGILFSKASY